MGIKIRVYHETMSIKAENFKFKKRKQEEAVNVY